MGLRVVGAGLGRTGTTSLKAALEQLTGGRCYHMSEVFGHLDTHPPVWTDAIRGGAVDWDGLLDGYDTIVDWPGASCWAEMAAAYPDAVVLLSTRSDAEAWYRSASDTIFLAADKVRSNLEPDGPLAGWLAMVEAMMEHDGMVWGDHDSCVAGYEAHNAAVRAAVPADRLVEWQPGDGWGPLAAMLGVAEPSVPFPHANTTDEFRAQFGLGA